MPCYVTYKIQWSETGTILKESEVNLFKEIADGLGVAYKLERQPNKTYSVLTQGTSIKPVIEKVKAKQIQKEARKRYNMVTKFKKVKVGN